MSDSSDIPFPGAGEQDERSEKWKEYMEIRGRADSWYSTAHDMVDKNPRGAQVAATLALGCRLEAATYLISKMRSF